MFRHTPARVHVVRMTLIATIKSTLRAQRQTGNPVVRLAIRVFDAARGSVRPFWMFALNRRYRATTLLRWFHPERLHQTAALTCMNRYPQIFGACRDLCVARQDLRILSFGCSSGEEVITLRQYFPDAYIVGADINPESLAQCRRQPVDARMAFVLSEPTAIAAHGPFDLVFCMAVLQRTPRLVEAERLTSLKKLYPFERFDRQVAELDSYLRRTGLLVIHHTQYFFRDTSVAGKYVVLDEGRIATDYPARFDRNCERVDVVSGDGSIFRKVQD